jgi:hypothetical protein
MNDYVITETRQIGIKANSHDEAIKAVVDGGGDLLSKVVSANFRQAQAQPSQQLAQQQLIQQSKSPTTKSAK